MNTSPTTPTTAINKIADGVLQATDLMCDIFLRETEALERFDNQEFLSLQAEKLDRARVYQQNLEVALARGPELAALPPALREDLERRYASFQELSARNLVALERMRKTTTQLGETIRGAVMTAIKSTKTYGYGESGKIADHKKSLSMGLSETA